MAVRKFNNLEEINQFLTNETRKSLEETLRALAPRLKHFIDEDVYWAYHPTFYKRTRWLKRSGVVDYYISNLQNKVRGGVRITNNMYNSLYNGKKFQHGNPYRQLSAEDFIEILNDETDDWYFNPFGFPYLRRESFWQDYLDWVKENYAEVFRKKCKKNHIDLDNLGSTETSDSTLSQTQSSISEPAPSSENTPTSVTGTSLDRDNREQIGWHSIGSNKKTVTKGLNLFFGIGSQNTVNNSALDSYFRQAESERSGFISDSEKGRADSYKHTTLGHN